MAIDQVLNRAAMLERAMDKVVESAAEDLETQAYADWAWYRFKSVIDLVLQRGAGPVAASLARGLLEEAAYWDWALATGVGAQHLVRRASVEYDGLVRLASEVDDAVWVGWLLPPGAVLSAPTDDPIPRNAGDAVKRIGNGIAAPVLDSLRFRGLFAANHLLDVLTHGNLAAALVMAPGGGEEMPEPLAAAVVHVAAAGATATIAACLNISAETIGDLSRLVAAVADEASGVHGLPRIETAVAKRPAKARAGIAIAVSSDIERMLAASPTTTAEAKRFLEAATKVAHLAVKRIRASSPEVRLMWAAFQLSWSQMMLFAGVVDGTIGRALLPFAARSLLEDGARWEWVRQRAVANPPGDSLRAIVGESKRYIHRVREAMISEGVRSDTVDGLLGHAGELLAADPGSYEMPAMSELLRVAYANPSGVDSARVEYSVLSQFVHASPLVLFHLRRDQLPSVTAPIYAIAVEAACRGFWNIARTTLTFVCEQDAALEESFIELAFALRDVLYDASVFHVLG